MAKTKRRSTVKEVKITTGIVGENDSFDRDIKSMEPNANKKRSELDALKKQPLQDKRTHPVWAISRLPQSAIVSYGGESIVIPPKSRRGDCFIPNARLLGKLPKGVVIVPAKEKSPKKR